MAAFFNRINPEDGVSLFEMQRVMWLALVLVGFTIFKILYRKK
jgi:hypothetical protein